MASIKEPLWLLRGAGEGVEGRGWRRLWKGLFLLGLAWCFGAIGLSSFFPRCGGRRRPSPSPPSGSRPDTARTGAWPGSAGLLVKGGVFFGEGWGGGEDARRRGGRGGRAGAEGGRLRPGVREEEPGWHAKAP